MRAPVTAKMQAMCGAQRSRPSFTQGRRAGGVYQASEDPIGRESTVPKAVPVLISDAVGLHAKEE